MKYCYQNSNAYFFSEPVAPKFFVLIEPYLEFCDRFGPAPFLQVTFSPD